jgi:hypothetical protein
MAKLAHPKGYIPNHPPSPLSIFRTDLQRPNDYVAPPPKTRPQSEPRNRHNEMPYPGPNKGTGKVCDSAYDWPRAWEKLRDVSGNTRPYLDSCQSQTSGSGGETAGPEQSREAKRKNNHKKWKWKEKQKQTPSHGCYLYIINRPATTSYNIVHYNFHFLHLAHTYAWESTTP